MDLEKIFDDIERSDKKIREDLIDSMNCKAGYSCLIDLLNEKSNAESKIKNFFRKQGIFKDKKSYSIFSENLKLINQDSLFDTFLGIYTKKGEKLVKRPIPKEIIKGLSNRKDWGKWSLVYFYNGLWENSNDHEIEHQHYTLYGIVRKLVLKGWDSIEEKNKDNGIHLKLPYKKEFRKYFHYPNSFNGVDTSFIDFPTENSVSKFRF